MAPSKIAIVRLDKIGDLILTTPAIASLKKAYPKCQLTAIVSRYSRAVLEGFPQVDQVWEWSFTFENIQRLREEKYELVVVFSPTTLSYMIALLSGARIRAGYVYLSRPLARLFSRIALNRRLVVKVDQKEVRNESIQVPHEIEQNLEVLRALGIPEDQLISHLEIPLPSETLKWARSQLGNERFVCIHLSRAWQLDLESDFLHKLFRKLSEHVRLFATYGPHELGLAFSLRGDPNVKQFGELAFSQWAALIHESDTVITTNTGAVHLAASQHVPVVAVFEPEFFTYHRKRWSPWEVPHLILRKDDPELLQKIIQGVATLAKQKENISSNLHT